MGKSKKRKKKKPKRNKRAMGSGRLSAVERIERAKDRSTKPSAAPAEPTPTVRTDPAAAGLIAQARQIGLSVADDTSADRVTHLLQRFDLVSSYTHQLWAALGGRPDLGEGPSSEQLKRVAAGLFDDGRLADRIVAAQRRRSIHPGPRIAHDATFRRVARSLREHFGQYLPRRSLLSRLLGR